MSWRLCKEKSLDIIIDALSDEGYNTSKWVLKDIPKLLMAKLSRSKHFFSLLLFLFLIYFPIADLSLAITEILLYTQKPSPYSGLVYADLNHSTTSNTGPVKREFPTVYADIDYAKTDTACSKLPEENLDQTTESDDP